jgi:DNA-binding beta-propeller fold protein YncE
MKTLAAIFIMSAAAVSATEPLGLKATVPLPGVKGRFDHFAVDTNTHRIFVAALGNNTLEIIDAAAKKRLHSITGLRKPTGVAFLPDRNQIVVANGDDGTVKVFDGISYKLIKSIPGLDDADNVRLDAKANRIYVGYGDGAIAVIDTKTLEQVDAMKLKAHPESFQLEQNGPRIFVNVPDARQVAVVDRDKRTVAATWPMEKFRANFPMALDASNHRVLIGCRQPARLIVLDAESGTAVANLPISGDTDDLFYDAKRKRLYVSCGEGFLDVIESPGADRYERIGRIPTRSGARTCFFSSALNQLYLAVPQRGGLDAEIRIYEPE